MLLEYTVFFTVASLIEAPDQKLLVESVVVTLLVLLSQSPSFHTMNHRHHAPSVLQFAGSGMRPHSVSETIFGLVVLSSLIAENFVYAVSWLVWSLA